MSVTEAKQRDATNEDEIEIRLSDVVKFLKDGRWRVLIGASIGIIVGGLYAFSQPNVYTTQVTVMPELQTKGASGLGNLSSLAGLAGIDINSATGGGIDAIRPDVYPDVLQSVPFALQLLQQPVYVQLLQKETLLQAFFDARISQSFFGGLFPSEDDGEVEGHNPKNRVNVLQITRKQETLVKEVQKAVLATYDKKTGIIKIAVTLPDPGVAADVARLSLDYLTTYISNYRTEKARNQVRFLISRVADARHKYQTTEFALSSYKDRNRNVFLNTAKIEEQRLQGDFLLAQSVFNDLSKQLEQAKIKVAEDAPVFKALEPPTVPLRKSGPKRSLIIAGFVVVGVLAGLVFHGLRRFNQSLR